MLIPEERLLSKLFDRVAESARLKVSFEGGSSSAVERQLPKLDVTGSIPVSRSSFSGLLPFQVTSRLPSKAADHCCTVEFHLLVQIRKCELTQQERM